MGEFTLDGHKQITVEEARATMATAYEIYVPLTYNGGSPIAVEKLEEVVATLIDQFHGLTLFPPAMGFWVNGGRRFEDRIMIAQILVTDKGDDKQSLVEFSAWLARELAQEVVLLVTYPAQVIYVGNGLGRREAA